MTRKRGRRRRNIKPERDWEYVSTAGRQAVNGVEASATLSARSDGVTLVCIPANPDKLLEQTDLTYCEVVGLGVGDSREPCPNGVLYSCLRWRSGIDCALPGLPDNWIKSQHRPLRVRAGHIQSFYRPAPGVVSFPLCV